MRSLLNISILTLLFCVCSNLFGQQILFKHYSVSEGLPSSTVRAIVQDRQGFMWFGTKNGLSRFDGYQFKNFQYKKNIAGTLGSNFIHCLWVADDTHLWVGTEDGLYILDLETEKFTRLEALGSQTVYDIAGDRSGRVYMTTNQHGVYLYQMNNHALSNIGGINGNALQQPTKLIIDDKGCVWMGTEHDGIIRYEPGTKQFTQFNMANSGFPSNNIISIYNSVDGRIWAGAMGGGLFCINRNGEVLKSYSSGGEFGLKDNIVRSICQTGPDKLYVGTEKGINILDLATDKFRVYTNISYDPFSLSDNAVYAIYPDKSGLIWVATWFGGVNYFTEKASAFEMYYPTGSNQSLSGRAVSCFLEYEPGNLWIGTEDGGLNFFNEQSKTFQSYPFRPGQQKLSYHNIHALAKDRKGQIWVGIFAGGINVLDPASGQVRVYQHNPADETTLDHNLVFSLYENRDGTMWVGTTRGLNYFDTEKGHFVHIQLKGLGNLFVYDMYEDANSVFWIASYNNGLISWNRKTGKWNHFTTETKPSAISSNKLICIYADQRGNLWIGTDGGGLNRFDLRTGQVKVYDEAEGISGNIIYGIVEDDNNLLWLTTNNGIYNLDTKTEKFRHFTRQDNLQGQQFNYKAFYKASDGKLYAGGIKGFNSFYPQNTNNYLSKAHLMVTNFQLFNRNVPIGEEKLPLKKQISFTDTITLLHNQSVISFEYAALNYLSPEKIRYAYKMEGFDPDWNYVGEQRKATYTNLPHGKYTFIIKASTDESNWDVPEKKLTIIIRPPWYKTTLAFIGYIIAVMAIGYFAYRYTGNYIRRQNQIKLERLKNKEEREFYARKIEFFTVMAHEIRTPLSLIIAPLEKLIALNKWEPAAAEQLKIMDVNAERLMDLVNQLLDFRRIESDAYEIRMETVDVVSLVQSIYSRFSALPYQKAIEFTMSTQLSTLTMNADPEVLDKVLSNLLMNAFKFARKKVSITIHELVPVDQEQSILRISVSDDGIGIPGADLKNIFRKFFTTSKGGHQYHNLGSTGIGLALASSLAEKHGGSLLVESKEGVATIFNLELPYAGIATVAPKIATQDEINDGRSLVLVVEDDQSILDFLAQSFAQEGYNVLKAKHGEEALTAIKEHDVDLVVSDLMMPVMDGIALCREVKNNVDFSHIPFIMLTAKGNSESEIEGIESGADAYIIKPFKWKHLSAMVKNLVEVRERLRRKFSENPAIHASELTTNSRDKAFMEQLVQAIRNRIMDPQLSVEDLSREMAMSRALLHKKVKSLSGYVPNELIKLIKLKHAAQLLQTSGHTMAEVAYLSGFNTPSYFAKCFHAQFKLTPSDYAEQFKTSSPVSPEEWV